MAQLLIASLTTPDRPTAERIAAVLVERHLAACVQIGGPITSVYRWKGAIETAEEWLCTAKTTDARWPELQTAVRELHPYETPELVATPLTHAAADYRAWLLAGVHLP